MLLFLLEGLGGEGGDGGQGGGSMAVQYTVGNWGYMG